MSEYEAYMKSGIAAEDDRTKYAPTRFVCRACEAALYWKELYCRKCDAVSAWCSIRKENGSYLVKL